MQNNASAIDKPSGNEIGEDNANLTAIHALPNCDGCQVRRACLSRVMRGGALLRVECETPERDMRHIAGGLDGDDGKGGAASRSRSVRRACAGVIYNAP